MIAVAVALIGLIGIVVLEIYNNRKSYKKIIGKIGDIERGALSGQHDSIEEFIELRHGQLIKNIDCSINKIQKISDELIKNSVEQEWQFGNTHEYQKKIDQHITEVEDLIRDWKHVVIENAELKVENEKLKNKYYELLNEN